MDHHNPGGRSRLPQAPWVLYFDGASRKPAGQGGLGTILRNSKGQVVSEERRFLGGGISSGLAKYKALLAGMEKAKSLQVKHLLAKGNSRLLINQVVGRWTVRDSHLRDHLRKVWVISKEFDSLFMEFTPKDQNTHADRIANAAIDKEIQILGVATDYLDRSRVWSSPSPQVVKEPAPVSPAGRGLSPFSKLRPVSPLPKKSALKASVRVMFHGDDLHTSDSELTRTITSLRSTKADRFWHGDLDRLSISDESSTGVSEPEESLPESTPGPAAAVACREASHGEAQGICRPALYGAQQPCTAVPVNVDQGSEARSTIQLSEADCDRLVNAVIERLKKNKPGAPDD